MGKRIALDNYKIANKKKKPNAADLHKSSSEESSSEDEEFSDISLTATSIKYKESPKLEYQLTQGVNGDLVNGVILTDLTQKQWRIGKPIGKGSFGEIFLASDNINSSITNENAKYVVKIEPHSNGPLFVEIHCLLNTAKGTEEEPLPLGMPEYIASGSHYFRDIRYRFLILPRYDRDLHSIIKNRRIDQKSVLILAIQILDILQHIHNKGYCHSDIKAENLMIGKCTYSKSLQKKYDEKLNKDNYDNDSDYNENNYKNAVNNDEDSYDDDDDDNDDEDSEYKYYTPVRNRRKIQPIQYSGSNPVRSCRTNKPANTIYQEMINSHYLRPVKKINYSEYFNDENSKSSYNDDHSSTIDDYISNHRLSNKNTRKSTKKLQQNSTIQKLNDCIIEENHIYLIDFGLASKFIDSNGVHRPFCMDQRRAHDGTLEFTSRDAHMGAHSRRSDLECLGYNLIFWSQGYLPWKEKADKQQHEKVHWMKEYLMTDVKEMLKHIYGKQVPKYLGDFMDYVGKLAYDERPNYIKCKMIFQRELEKLNIKSDKWKLNINEMIANSIDINDEIENNNFKEMKNIKSIMKNLGVLMPFRENNTNNRVSPKNLRSKSDKNSKKKKKKFSWAEILSQNPDQIARERAEKEYERVEQTTETPVNRYQGKPTYAILDIQKRIKFKDRLALLNNDIDDVDDNDQFEFNCKGYTKPMIEIFKKRQANRLSEYASTKKQQQLTSATNHLNHNNNKKNSKELTKRTRTKEGLRTIITPTKRAMDYNHSINIQKTKRRQNLFMKKSTLTKPNNNNHNNHQLCETDESSSCSSNLSVASSTRSSAVSSQKSELSEATTTSTLTNKRLRRYQENGSSGNSNSSSILSNGNGGSGGATSSSFQASISDEDTRDVMVVFNPKRTRFALKKMKIKINGSSAIIKEVTPPITIVVSPQNNNNSNNTKLSRADKSVSRRKKSVPQKRNHKGEIMRCV